MMKLAAAAGIAVATAQEVREYTGYDFDAYLSEFGKTYTYDRDEHHVRKAIFEKNLKIIAEHNEGYKAGHHSWFAAVNHLTDMTPEEFRRLRATHYSPSTVATAVLGSSGEANAPSMDWREKNAVTEVKNQGGCGSCWAFSATETVESAYAIASGKLLKLAPQTYVNCVKNPQECGGTGGCEGATMELAFNLTAQTGIALESDMPYAGRDQTCKTYTPAVKATGFVKNPVNDAKALETAVAQKGPQAITVAAGAWQLYGGGLFTGCSKGIFSDNTLDHGVQLVGYTQDYWIVRNSWGAGWGERGYIRVSRAADSQTFTDSRPADGVACKPYPTKQTVGGECGILFDTSYPTGVTAGTEDAVDKSEKKAVRHSKGFKRSSANLDIPVANLTAEEIASAPDSIDWSAKGATSSVNDQGQCGSCWAFSTMEGVESGVFMSTGKLPPKLSVQELVACEKQDDGCDGGDIPEAVSYLKKKGMATQSSYPDTSSKSGKNGRCKSFQPAVKVTGMQYAIPPCNSGDCSKQNEEALAAALAKYGPLSICINSGDGQSGDWEKYNGGILKGSCKGKASLIDHCVQLVGYDKSASQPYWKIRNSWAKDWGEEGFIRIPYGNGNECCVGCEAVIISATTEEASTVVV